MNGNLRFVLGFLLVGGAVLGAPPAFGSEATEPRCTEATADECLDGVSAGVTGGESLRVVAQKLSPRDREEEERDRLSAGFGRQAGTGRAAGELGGRLGLWASAGYSGFDGNPTFGASITRFEADLANVLVGADYRLGERVVLGAAFGYERLDTETAFNGGGNEARGLTVAPYGLFILTDVWSVDLAAGYTSLENDQDRLDTAAPGTGRRLRSAFDSYRWFVTGNLSYARPWRSWVFGAQVGYLYTEEEQDGYTESGGQGRTVADRHIDLSEGHASVSAGYALGAFEPYVRAGYYHDFSRDDGQEVGGLPGGTTRTVFDDDEWRLALGLRYYGASGVSGNLEIETEQGRKNFSSTSVLFTIRGEF